MADDLGERTEEATPRRLIEARERGQVARSADFASACLLAATALLLCVALLPMLSRLGTFLRSSLDPHVLGGAGTHDGLFSLVGVTAWLLLTIVLPTLMLIWLCGYLSYFLQIGWLISGEPLKPKFSKLSPLSGIKRILGTNAVVKAGLDSLKVLLVVTIASVTIMQYGHTIVTLPELDTFAAWGVIGRIMRDLAIRLLLVLLLLGLADFMYQRWKHRRDMRMTKQQVKDEMKHTEGDPEVKRRRLRMQQQIAMQRIGTAVPKADVIVTNPEHVSIAIEYKSTTMRAPRVIAKGADHLALRIRQLAMQHQIPIVQRPPLARALYRQVKVAQEIPPDFYQAVAEVLAHVYRMSGRAA
jgi:flagellar biosynthetic protein FlhB